MFPYLKSGGIFVIEDLHTANNYSYTRPGDVATLEILHEWKFPPNIIMAVAGHHHPERLTGDFYKIAYVVCLAEGATWLMDENNGFYPSKPKQISKQLLRHLQLENMTKDELIPLALRAREDAVASGMLSMF
jgi:HD-like signal output (HDOD) protein